jgi:hypothetical protein
MEVPKEKKDILETTINRDTCGYGIYPGLHPLEKAGTGKVYVPTTRLST